MKVFHLPGYVLFATVLLLVGTLALQNSLLGKTVSGVLVSPPPADQNPAADTVAAVPDTAPSAVDSLMAQIRQNPRRLTPLPPTKIDAETLWLARCIYSETKRPEEMELIAWVVRNRVETRYRDKRTYRDVILDPYQFSAFNPGTRTRRHYSALNPQHTTTQWQQALAIAYGVRQADTTQRPFSVKTRHFYSERSMVGQRHPDWARGMQPVSPDRNFQLDERRFRFFAGVY